MYSIKSFPFRDLILHHAVILSVLIFFSGCSTVYYSTMETFGKHKRDLLKDNVEALRDNQIKASDEFKDALTSLQELTNYDGGHLQDIYEEIKDDYEECRSRADAIKNRIRKIDTIAHDLFNEWEDEIGTMSNAGFKRKSQRKLNAARKKFRKFHTAMIRSEKTMEPVLTALHDHVIFLKHNLNAQTISGIRTEVGSIEADVKSLIHDMKVSIAEANAFINTLPQ